MIHDNCKNKNIFYDQIIVLTHHKNRVIQKMIHDAKFYGKKDIFIDFGGLLSEKTG